MTTSRKVILYIAMSLDGYIATKDNSIDFLSMIEQEGEDYGYNNFVKSVDAVIIGRKTYEKVIAMGYEYPHKDKDVYILTRTAKPSIGNFKFYTDDLSRLVNDLKSQPGKNIYCDGGAEIANELMKNNLVDEFIISVIPILLGDGIKLFKDGRPAQRLELISSKYYDKGLTQLHYNREEQ
ncbi:MAG: dihydrofolate reductase family protein [Bacteroidota bacterium]|jgi:dihydrofolate reductase